LLNAEGRPLAAAPLACLLSQGSRPRPAAAVYAQ